MGVSERIMGISFISYGKNSLDLRRTWVTTRPRERIEFVSQGPTVNIKERMGWEMSSRVCRQSVNRNQNVPHFQQWVLSGLLDYALNLATWATSLYHCLVFMWSRLWFPILSDVCFFFCLIGCRASHVPIVISWRTNTVIFRSSEIMILWHPIQNAVADRKQKEYQETVTTVWLLYVVPPPHTQRHMYIVLAYADLCTAWREIVVTAMMTPLACVECDDSLPLSGASSIPPFYIFFPATLLHQPFSHSPSLYPAIYFLVCIQHSYGNLFSSVLFTCPNQRNLRVCSLIVSIMVGFYFKETHKFIYYLISSNFRFHFHILGLEFFCDCNGGSH
jgi:hypothetical protein